MKGRSWFLATAIVAVLGVAPAPADPTLLTRAAGELTFVGGARGPTPWMRAHGVVTIGPDALADSDGVIDASTGRGCIIVGTSIQNLVVICDPFERGEVQLVMNSLEHGDGVLLVNTLGRLDPEKRAVAVVPFSEHDAPVIGPLSPLFWLPWVTHEVTEDQAKAEIREYQASFYDIDLAYVWVNGTEAIYGDGSGIVVTDARLAAELAP